jgi:hypothetical protein
MVIFSASQTNEVFGEQKEEQCEAPLIFGHLIAKNKWGWI